MMFAEPPYPTPPFLTAFRIISKRVRFGVMCFSNISLRKGLSVNALCKHFLREGSLSLILLFVSLLLPSCLFVLFFFIIYLYTYFLSVNI